MRRPIRELPAAVVNQIAAGEVIERPASVVKELLENALDAGASQITVELLEGGRDLIRVVDDGAGIRKAELGLAVKSHATSKLADAGELFAVRSLGFRGEALASIAAVSDFRLQSRPADQPTGAAIEVQHGAIGPVRDCGCPPGTQVEVRNLFASLPVRRKFLKHRQTELGHVTEAIIRLALARPGVGLKMVHHERVVIDRRADLDERGTIGVLFSPDLVEHLVTIDSQQEGLRLHGFVADPSVERPDSRWQYLFVNGRFFRDRSLGHAVAEAYRGLLLTGRYPVVFLHLDLPPERVDVNVHPTKLEVRFQEPQQVYSRLLAAIRTRFLSLDLTSKLEVRAAASNTPVGAAPAAAGPIVPAVATKSLEWEERRGAINESFALAPRSVPERPGSLFEAPSRPAAAGAPPNVEPQSPLDAPVSSRPVGTLAPPLPPSSAERPNGLAHSAGTSGAPRPLSSEVPTAAPRTFQVHNTYLVVETDEGMLLVDQHALHERVLYEELRHRIGSGALEVQELLVPEPIDLPAQQVGSLLEQRELLGSLGLRIEEFGDRCVLLQSFPAMLRRYRPEELVRDVAARLEQTGRAPSREQLLEELLHLMACKAAVKAGDPLTAGEIDELLRRRQLVEDSHHCPHGRPSVLRFTLADLQRQFRRT